jgi:protein-tyrosine kinase
MNADLASLPNRSTERALIAALTAQCQLTAETVVRIHDIAHTMNCDFGAAALRLGVASEHDVEIARMKARAQELNMRPGLVEAAIRKLSSARTVSTQPGALAKPAPQLVLAHDSEHAHSEKMRALRTELLLLTEPNKHASMMALLSPCSGEGRSQLCAELAIAFAQLDRKVLLVDADMRKPQQHQLFATDNERGLSQAIANNEHPCIHPVEGLPQLSLLTAGAVPSNPLELLSDAGFRKLMDEWRQDYDFVVLDTPPVSAYADALVVAALARQVLLLCRAHNTEAREARELLRRLAHTQSRVVGAIINYH